MQSLRNFVLQFEFGAHLFVQNAKSDIFKESYNRNLVFVEHLLSNNMNQQDIVLVELLQVCAEHSVRETDLLVPSKAHVIIIFFYQH